MAYIPGGGGASVFTDLTDVPAAYTGEAGSILAVTVGEDGLEFVEDAGGAESFTDLDDVPEAYTGEAGKFLAVTDEEDGLEFVDGPATELEVFSMKFKTGDSSFSIAGSDVVVDWPSAGLNTASSLFTWNDAGNYVTVAEAGTYRIDLAMTFSGDGNQYFVNLQVDSGSGFAEDGDLQMLSADVSSGEATACGSAVFALGAGDKLRVVGSSTAASVRTASTFIVQRLGSPAQDSISAFTELTDVPSAYTDQGGKLVAVNTGATALEFVDAPVSSALRLFSMHYDSGDTVYTFQTGSESLVTWPTERINTDGTLFTWTGGSDHYVTIAEAGIYRVTIQVNVNSGGQYYVLAEIDSGAGFANTLAGPGCMAVYGEGRSTAYGDALMTLAAGDKLRFVGRTTVSTANVTFQGTGFSIQRIGDV